MSVLLRPHVLVIVGGGPTATSFLERFVANAPELVGEGPVEVHLVEPYPAGAGRVWRHEQSPLLRMNSMAEDVTMFTDDSVTCAGPIRPGPALDEWAHEVDAGRFPPEVAAELAELDGTTFPTRRLQSAYLQWVFERVVDQAPANVRIVVHQDRVTGLTGDADGPQVVHLAGSDVPVVADVVVLAMGHIDVGPSTEQRVLADFAARHGCYYLPPAYSADVDLSGIAPGQTVVMRGFGLAFIDLTVLLTEGRGGTFSEDGAGGLVYHPSGREPRLWVGSRRGVPYRSKLGYRLQGARPNLPRFLTNDAVDALVDAHPRLEFRAHVWPLLAKEVGWAYYQELFTGHPERTTMAWADFDAAYAPLGWGSPEQQALVAAAVPAEVDRLDFEQLDRPLRGKRFDGLAELEDELRHHIQGDVGRRADAAFSADLGAFGAFLSCFRQIPRVVASGHLTPRSRVEELDGWWFGFFSYFASGPPPFRLRELLALNRAGVVGFLGADLWVEADDEAGCFRAGSASTPDVVTATGLIEARLPRINVSLAPDELLQALLAEGEVTEDELVDELDDARLPTGRLRVSAEELRVLDRDGNAHIRRFALGAGTSRPAAGTFARPRTNAPAFRQNDAVARAILSLLASSAPVAAGDHAPATS